MAMSFRQLAGIPNSTASTSDSVLIIVDAQGEYADGHLKVTNLATSRPALQKLYERYRDAGGHVVHVVHEVSFPCVASFRERELPNRMRRKERR